MALPNHRSEREYNKFVADANGNTAVRAVLVSGTITSNSTGADGAKLTLFHNKANPDPFDGSLLNYDSQNNAAEQVTYASLKGIVIDNTDGAEQGGFIFNSMYNGVLTPTFVTFIDAGNTVVAGQTGAISFQTDSNNNIQFFPNGTGLVQFYSSDGGASGRIAEFYQESASPSAGDLVGTLRFAGENSADEKTSYATYAGGIYDTTDGAEFGYMGNQLMQNGTLRTAEYIYSDSSDSSVVYTIGDADVSGGYVHGKITTPTGGDLRLEPAGGVSTSKLFKRADAASVMSSGGTHAMQGVIVLTGDELKAKLDTSTNNIFDTALPANTAIFDVALITSTAAGTAGNISVGSDANWGFTASTSNAWVNALNANTPGAQRATIAGNAGQNGDLAISAGNLTITSSTDLSASSWQGALFIFYTAAEAFA